MDSEVFQNSGEREALRDIRGILDSQKFTVLSSHAEGQPYANLIAFAATDDLRRILFCTPRSTRKYANISRDPRTAMLFHTSSNKAADCREAMSVTATGTVVEVPDNHRGAEAEVLMERHPALAEFFGDVQNALLALEVEEYHLVRRFQDVIRIGLARGVASSLNGNGDGELKAESTAILLAHGSRDEAGRASFEQFASSLAGSLGAGRVRVAYLQLSPPTLLEAVTAAAEEGFRRIAILPLFISAGGHVMRDVPSQVSEVQNRWSGLEITVLPRVGEDRRFAELVEKLVCSALARPGAPRE